MIASNTQTLTDKPLTQVVTGLAITGTVYETIKGISDLWKRPAQPVATTSTCCTTERTNFHPIAQPL